MVLRVDPEFAAMLDRDAATAALGMAFEAWRGFPGVPDLIIKHEEPRSLGHHGKSATNGIYLIEDWPYEDDKLAVTVVTYELENGRLLDADVLVNADIPFDLLVEDPEDEDGPAAYDLAAVLTHEAGHMLGLGESQDDPKATMWPYARMGDTHQRTLSEDDEEGIIAAYSGAAPPPITGCGGMSVAGRRAADAPLLQLCALALLVLLARTLWARPGARRRTLSIAAGMGMLLSGGGTVPLAQSTEQAAGVIGVREADEHGTLSAHQGPRFAAALMADDAQPRLGTVRRIGARFISGLIYTDYEVVHRDGTISSLRVPGGQVDGIAQRVGELDPPRDGAELLIARPSDGSERWAYHDNGRLHGGWLGHDHGLPLE